MEKIIAKCGIRCDLCPAHEDKLTTDQDKEKMSQAFSEYYDYKLSPEDIKPCKGCNLLDKPPEGNCSVFFCVKEKQIPNCAHCNEFPCKNISDQMNAFDETMKKHPDIPQAEYEKFCKPYENRKTLQEIRDSLKG